MIYNRELKIKLTEEQYNELKRLTALSITYGGANVTLNEIHDSDIGLLLIRTTLNKFGIIPNQSTFKKFKKRGKK